MAAGRPAINLECSERAKDAGVEFLLTCFR